MRASVAVAAATLLAAGLVINCGGNVGNDGANGSPHQSPTPETGGLSSSGSSSAGGSLAGSASSAIASGGGIVPTGGSNGSSGGLSGTGGIPATGGYSATGGSPNSGGSSTEAACLGQPNPAACVPGDCGVGQVCSAELTGCKAADCSCTGNYSWNCSANCWGQCAYANIGGVPVLMGGAAVTEQNSRGYDSTVPVRWLTDQFTLSSTGRIQGSIRTTTSGPTLELAVVADVLFLDVEGTYVWEPYGDYTRKSLTSILPIVAVASEAATATFAVDGVFDAPDTVLPQSQLLEHFWVLFTWVRVYGQKGAYDFSIYPGRDPSPVRFKVDEPSGHVEGALAYFPVISESNLAPAASGAFDYHGWIVQNLLQ